MRGVDSFSLNHALAGGARLHERFEASATFDGPWNGSAFETFERLMAQRILSAMATRLVALRVFIDRFGFAHLVAFARR